MQFHTPSRRVSSFAAFLALAAAAPAAELSPSTIQAWDAYLANAQACARARLRAGGTFLWIDESPDCAVVT
jgi:hypothetical protein